jgi:hypothetical protein
MISSGWVDWRFISSSKFSTYDDVTEFEGEYCSILKSGFKSLAMEMDGTVEGRSMDETLDLRLSPVVVTTETMTPFLLLR